MAGGKLLDQIRDVCRRKGLSSKTSASYCHWCESFFRWCRQKNGRWIHPRDVGREVITEWLTHLATVRNVAPSTQNVAFQAVLFLYRQILHVEITEVDALRAKRPQRVPVVLSRGEVAAIIERLGGQNRLIAMLCYGAGMRIGEAVSLRLKDIDFANQVIVIRAAKGAKDRVVQLPVAAEDALRNQIRQSQRWHAIDIDEGLARVALPYSFERKSPQAASQLGWYWLFCSHVRSKCPDTGRIGRHHVDESNFGRALSIAAKSAGILKRVTSHTLRHSYATHMLNSGVNIREIQKLLGHSSVKTTQIYTHVDSVSPATTTSPLDRLLRIAQ